MNNEIKQLPNGDFEVSHDMKGVTVWGEPVICAPYVPVTKTTIVATITYEELIGDIQQDLFEEE